MSGTQKAAQTTTYAAPTMTLADLVEWTGAAYSRLCAAEAAELAGGPIADFAFDEFDAAAGALDLHVRDALVPIANQFLDGLERDNEAGISATLVALRALPACARLVLVETWRPWDDDEPPVYFRVPEEPRCAYKFVEAVQALEATEADL